ncbi:MAG: hypothetical protein ACXVPN_09310 [Bacteroidia bacterium]
MRLITFFTLFLSVVTCCGQKIDTVINSTYNYSPFDINQDSSFIRTNKIRRIISTDINDSQRKKVHTIQDFNRNGLIVKDSSDKISYRGGPNIVYYTYDQNNQLKEIKEIYPDKSIRICLMDFEKLLNEKKNMIYNKRYWREVRDTTFNTKKKIIETRDTGYTVRGGTKEVYEYDSLERVKKITQFSKYPNESNQVKEELTGLQEFSYLPNGYTLSEKFSFRSTKNYVSENSRPVWANEETTYLYGFSSPIQIVYIHRNKGRRQIIMKKEFEYFSR